MFYEQNKKLILFLICVLVVSIMCVSLDPFKSDDGDITINNIKIKVEKVAEDIGRYRGLSGRDELCDKCGMLFIFEKPQILEFVMREMKFPLDIIFINGDQVIKIYKNLPPEGINTGFVYGSDGLADKALEVNGGFSDKYGIKEGDNIKL